MKRAVIGLIVLVSFFVAIGVSGQQISLTEEEAEEIGNKIFYNECGGKDENLITWNKGEDFISLGIGHFIWYTKDRKGPFDESFPELLEFFEENDQALPEWLDAKGAPYCPWKSREEFIKDLGSPQVADLRKLLTETKSLQLIFIVSRLTDALPKILEAASKELRPGIEQQFYRMASTASGMYALIDYVNFKGEGMLVTERYKGQGWGLLQVLERMQGDEKGKPALQEFVRAAEELLTERVKNSPPERDENRWLAGWKNRLRTYLE